VDELRMWKFRRFHSSERIIKFFRLSSLLDYQTIKKCRPWRAFQARGFESIPILAFGPHYKVLLLQMSTYHLVISPGPSSGTTSSSSQSEQKVSVHGAQVPVSWLLNTKSYPTNTLSTPDQIRQAKRDVGWAKNREQLIAGAAAGVHLAMFSFNLAFWGFEGTPPDRYNPNNVR
jgi:hypothetical protein